MTVTSKRILILYYSHSSQTRNLLQALAAGLESGRVEVCCQQIKPVEKLQFPLGSIWLTLVTMITSFFRRRIEIRPIDKSCYSDWDLIILAGPTWSYSPSGPVLSLFDSYGAIFKERKVLPFISCRGYWRLHALGLKSLLLKKRGQPLKPIVFLHAGIEPWRTIGVFLKLAGKVPESRKSWISKYYTKYGHTREQIEYARTLGRLLAEKLNSDGTFKGIDIRPIKWLRHRKK